MRRFRDRTPPARTVADLLFPELAGTPAAPLVQGILRAPPRGRVPPPWLSALPAEAGAEAVLAGQGWEEPAMRQRAAAARRALVAARVGGPWWHDNAGALPPGDGYTVVALGEPPIAGCRPPAPDVVLAAMLAAAFAAHSPEQVLVLAPPGGRAPRTQLAAAARARGAIVIEVPLDPWAVLDRAVRVYSAGGELGFLALLAGVPVSVFAPAFYTGWGATNDAGGVPQRSFRRDVDAIFAGACLIATRYRDPFRGSRIEFEEALSIAAEWRRLDEVNRRIGVCVGMSFWKRRRIAEFVRSSAGAPVFRRDTAAALAAARSSGVPPKAIAGWASRLPQGLAEEAARQGIPLIRVEDGFIRSVGLGSDFLPPASLVFDTRGMYFDPRGASDLECLLREAEFPADLLARAERLAARLVERGITKYNLAAGEGRVAVPPGRRCILVPGQVEDDLSIRFGAGEVRTNLALLEAVRAANADAYILYKAHPDVLAGHRKGAVSETAARRFADQVVHAGSTAAWLAVADELHTMTSLAGFEALLRGRRVVVYGRPFYAGWGLTADVEPFERGRRLSLAQLVAGTLILYPRYLDPLTRLPCGPEVIIERLDDPELWRPGPLVLARRLQGMLVRRLAEFRAMPPQRRFGPGARGSRAAAPLMRAPYRVVAITGASSGLGAALALAYAAPQTALGLIGRNRERLAATAAACRAAGATVATAAIDVTEADSLAAWLAAFDRSHPVELLIANAGTSAGPDPDSPGEPAAITRRQIEVNLVGAVNTIAPLVPAMCARGRGRIVAVASVAAYRGLPYSPGYCASKAGLRAYAEALRPNMAGYGVGVTVVCPGFFSSPMTDRWAGPTPFLASGERAARHVKRGIDRGQARIAFPWPLVFGMRFCDLAPAWIGDAILRGFRFHIRSA